VPELRCNPGIIDIIIVVIVIFTTFIIIPAWEISSEHHHWIVWLASECEQDDSGQHRGACSQMLVTSRRGVIVVVSREWQ